MLQLARRAVVLAIVLFAHGAVAAPDPLAAIPDRYPGVAWFGGPDAPLLGYIKQLPDRPACVDEQLASVDGYLQAVLLQGPSLIALHGKLDRAKVEACIELILPKFGNGAHLERDGAFTVLAGKTSARYLGWGKDLVFLGDKAQVEEALAGKTSVVKNKELMALVARVDRKKQLWVAVAADYTSKLLGVPGRGMFFSGDALAKSAPLHDLRFTLVFGSPTDAKKAAAAIAAAGHDKRYSQALQDTLAALNPVAKGNDVLVDPMGLLTRPDLLQEMTALMLKLKG